MTLKELYDRFTDRADSNNDVASYIMFDDLSKWQDYLTRKSENIYPTLIVFLNPLSSGRRSEYANYPIQMWYLSSTDTREDRIKLQSEAKIFLENYIDSILIDDNGNTDIDIDQDINENNPLTFELVQNETDQKVYGMSVTLTLIVSSCP